MTEQKAGSFKENSWDLMTVHLLLDIKEPNPSEASRLLCPVTLLTGLLLVEVPSSEDGVGSLGGGRLSPSSAWLLLDPTAPS